jgi:hypothetical protein
LRLKIIDSDINDFSESKQGRAKTFYIQHIKMKLPLIVHRGIVKLYHLFGSQFQRHQTETNKVFTLKEVSLSEIKSKVVFSTWLNIHDPRKNIRFIIEAVNEYSQFFGKVCSLIVKIHGSDQDCEDVLKLSTEINQSFPNAHLQVFATNEYLTQDKLLLLRKKASIYLNASTGEGLCLPVIEHMLANCPAVVPKNSAFLDYPDSKYLKKVEVDAIPTYFPQDLTKEFRTHAQPPIRKEYIKAISDLVEELELDTSLIDLEQTTKKWLSTSSATDFMNFLTQK